MNSSRSGRKSHLAIVVVVMITVGCSEPESPGPGGAGESSPTATSPTPSTHTALPAGPRAKDTGTLGTFGHRTEVDSAFFEKKIVVLPGVFQPGEAEVLVLPFMSANPDLFRGKRVLEIGTGSGVIGIHAAKLGASSVVVTDINESAIASAKLNAERLGVASVIDQRHVSGSDISAFAVIRPDEIFDLIISNPPYSLDLDAASNNAVTDTGDLGFSIIDGLEDHLSSDGVAALFYDSLFYHLVMVKYAEHRGYAVEFRRPTIVTAWETEALFSSYLARLLHHRRLRPDTLRFDRDEDDLLLFVPSRQTDQSHTSLPAAWMFVRKAS